MALPPRPESRRRPPPSPRRAHRLIAFDDGADDAAVDRRHYTKRSLPASAAPSTSGAARAGACAPAPTSASSAVEARPVAEFDAGGIAPLRPIEIARQRDPALRAACRRRRSGFAAGARFPRSARSRRRRPTRKTNWRRSPAAAAPDRPADRDGRRPARRRGTRRPAARRAAPRRAPRPCRAAAGTRNRRRRRPARSRWRR